jgi:hypothetical protein
MPRRLTRANHERIQREIQEAKTRPPKPPLPEKLVRLSCGHQEMRQVESDTQWLETKGVCGACRAKQMLSGHRKDGR